MSFKNIGELFYKSGGFDFDELIDIIDSADDLKDVSKMFKSLDISKDAAEFALNASKYSDATDDIIDAVADLSNVSSGVSNVSSTIKGLGATIKSAILSPIGLATIAIGSFVGIMKLADAATVSFDEKLENSESSYNNYSQTSQEVGELKSQLEQVDAQIDSIKSKGKLTLSDKNDLQTLESQRKSLQDMLDVKERLENKEQKKAANDAVEVLKSEEDNPYYSSDTENRKKYQEDSQTTLFQNFDNSIAKAKDYKKELKNINSILDSGKENGEKISEGRKKSLEGQAKQYKKWISEIESDLDDTYTDILSQRKNFIDSDTGVALDGFDKYVDKIDSYTDKYDTYFGKQTEKQAEALSKIWEDDSFAQAQQKLVDAFRSGKDVSVKEITEQFPELVSACDDAGISVETLRDELMALADQDTGLTQIESDFEAFQSKAVSMINSLDAVNAAMVNSFSGKGLSIDIDKETGALSGDLVNIASLYGNLEGYDPSVLFEKTANGIHINREALRALQAQQEALQKQDFVNQETSLLDRYNQALAEVAAAKKNYGENSAEYTAAQVTADGLSSQLETVRQLASAYDGATSSYQKWLDAQSNGEEGDMYRTASETMKENGQKLYQEGRYNTEEFRAIAEYQSGQDLATASMEQVVAAYQSAENARNRYLTGTKEGIDNFMYDAQNTVPDLFEEVNGKLKFDLGDDKKLANALHISEEFAQNMLRAASEYSDNIVLGDTSGITDTSKSLEEMKSKAEEAKAKLQELSESNTNISADFNFDSTDVEDLSNQIERAKSNLDQFRNESGQVDLNIEGASEAVSILQTLIEQKQSVSQPAIMSVDTTGLDSSVADAVTKVQEYQSAINELNTLEQMKAVGIPVDTTQLDKAKAKVDSTFAELQSASQDGSLKINADVSVDTSSKEALNADISSMTPEITAKIKPVVSDGDTKSALGDTTSNATVNYTKGTQEPPTDKNAKVNYTKGQQYKAEDKNAKVNYTKGTQAQPKSPVTATVNYALGTVAKPGAVTVKVNYDTSGKPKFNGTAHANGTIHAFHDGNAHASGDWSIKHDETALVGELGKETVVRGGKFFTVGDDHAEFARLKAGDIVFNHKQTEELFKNGYVTSAGGRARVVTGGNFANGSAYSKGTWVFGNTGNGNIGGTGAIYTGSSSYSASTPKSSTASTKAVQQVTQAATKVTEDFFDFVEIYLDREKDITDKATDSIEDATNLVDKMSANSTALTKIQSEISANQQAYNRYMAQANSVGLSENYASQIRNGSLNIENITDENLKKQIDDYKKWYENAKKSNDAVTELQRQEKKLAQERLSYIEDVYDAIVKVHKSVQDINDSQLEYEEAMGFNNVSDAVKKVLQSSVDEQQKIYDQNLQRLTDYQNEFNSLVSNGYLKEGSEEYNEAKAQLNDFIKEINESATALIEFQDKLNEVEYKKIQNLIDGFDRAVSKLDKWVSLQESRDNDVPESTYQEQIDTNNANIKENYNLRNEKLKEQALYDVNSKRYQELAEDINKIDEETLGLLADNEKLKNSIFELRFKPLDDAIEKYDKLSDELGDFYDLLNEDAFFTKQGGGTADLAAGLALISQQIEVNKQKIADYRVGLDKLQESFDNGVISEKEFNEKSEEYISGVQNAAKANNSLSNSITDLYLKQIKAENDYLQESIDKHKELLNQRKESDAYEKKVKSQTKNINALKSQIQALEGTNNQQSQAELKRLRAQLQEAEDELTETRTDHQYDVREHGYNALSDSLNEMYKDTEYAVTHSAEKQQAVIQSMLNTVVSSYASAYEKINQIITNTGWIGSSDFNSNQDELNTQNGANNQVNNATQKPINTKPSDIANNTVTTPINSNDKVNAGIEHEIMQKPNTTNRPVAELKVSPTSISLEEGKTAIIKASIRPTDAANKTLSWGTSNESVATCANGTVKAIKPGSCQILVSTTDGSGITQNVSVTVTKKPDPPKPAPRPSSGGDGIPRVGDRVTLKAGQSYFYDSWGTRPAGSLYNGVPNGVIIDGYSGAEYGGQSTMHGGFGVHIKGADGVYGDLGWVRLDQLEGYASGTEYVDKEKLAWTQENKPEIIIRKKDGAMLTKLNPGDKVMDGKMTENIWKLAKNYPNIMNAQNLGINLNHTIPDVEVGDRDASIVNHYDSLLTVNGNVDRDALPELKQILKESYDYTVKNLVKDARLMGKHKSI